jgi:shikimate dehydrogenase
MPISPATALCGIVLHPASHTRSPAMHNAAYAALGLDAVFLAFDVPPARLAAAIAGARALGVRQLAVSIPHKESVLALLDEVDETARRIGAVNTVTLRDGRLCGANTDWLGLARALERETGLAGRRAVVLGAGGTARAATFALCERGARVWVLNRTPARAEALARELGAEDAGPLEALEKLDYEVLVNTTSVGLRNETSPVPASVLRRGAVVLDAVYDPPETRLLEDARARGARPVSGKWMLVEQAVEQIRLFCGRTAPAEVLARAFDEAGAAKPPAST